MKLLHISDLHIGKRVNGMSMVDDQHFILSQIVKYAKGNDVDAILVAGDIYDKMSPSAEAVSMLDAFLTELAEAGIHVLGIPGNHDSAERIAYVQGLLSSRGVCFPPTFSGSVTNVVLEDEHGEVVFWLLPFLKPGDVRRFFPDREIGDDYTAALEAALATCDIDTSKRNVILSHQLVTASGKSPERADDEIKLGGIDNVDFSVYDQFDYVALGHVHRPQRVGRDTVRYSGSPLKYSFSEARYPKSFVVVELGEKRDGDAVGECVSFELSPLAPLHDMREVRTTLQNLLAESADDAARGDYIHVILTDEHPQLDAMPKIREAYPNTMALDYDNAVILAHRAESRSAIDPDAMGTVELFARFYEEQVGKPMDEAQEEIAARVIRAAEESHARGRDEKSGGSR